MTKEDLDALLQELQKTVARLGMGTHATPAAAPRHPDISVAPDIVRDSLHHLLPDHLANSPRSPPLRMRCSDWPLRRGPEPF